MRRSLRTRSKSIVLAMVVAIVTTLMLPGVPALANTEHPDLTVAVTTTTGASGVGGTVTSSPEGISCPPDCSEPYEVLEEQNCIENPHAPEGEICETYYVSQEVTLSATPAPGWAFQSWGGACSGTSTQCSVTMNVDKSVTATFEDVSDPNIEVLSPVEGDVVGGTVALSANVTDNSEVEEVLFQVERGDDVLFYESDQDSPWGVEFDSSSNWAGDGMTSVSDGPVEVIVATPKRPGNPYSLVSETVNIAIDNTDPVANITRGPANGSSQPDRIVQFRYSVTDANPPDKPTSCRLDGERVPCTYAPVNVEESSGLGQGDRLGRTGHGTGSQGDDGSQMSPPFYLDVGEHTFRVTYTDEAGNIGSASRTWTVTRAATTLTLDVTKAGRKLKGRGVLKELPDSTIADHEAPVRVSLFKKKNGTFALIKSKTVNTVIERDPNSLDGYKGGRYEAGFGRPQGGKCKLVARYAGNKNRRGAKKATTFAC